MGLLALDDDDVAGGEEALRVAGDADTAGGVAGQILHNFHVRATSVNRC